MCISSGVRDENDRSYNPKIVRIGLKAHHSVRAVSMDNLVCLLKAMVTELELELELHLIVIVIIIVSIIILHWKLKEEW